MDWGLEAIGADHAYARGLSGMGVRLGIFDSGSDLRHPEFAGKDNKALVLADPGCTREVLASANDKGCFRTEGDKAVIEYTEGKAPEYQTHGTHVAGTMLANRDGKGHHGVAPGASLATVRLTSNNYTTSEGQARSVYGNDNSFTPVLDRMRDLNVRAINHSWGPTLDPNTVEALDKDLEKHRSGLGGGVCRRVTKNRDFTGMGSRQQRIE